LIIGIIEINQKNLVKNCIIRFMNAIEPLKENPEIGILNNKHHFRYILVKEYLIFYDYNDAEIIIHKIWDGRRNPENLEI